MTSQTKTVEIMTLEVVVSPSDITEGKCLLPRQCMEKIAIERALRNLDAKERGVKTSDRDHHVRIDVGAVKFNRKGWRWEAATPTKAKKALIQFDKEVHIRKRAEEKGEPFVSKVVPHRYVLKATKTTPIKPQTEEQAAASRRRRAKLKSEGRSYKRTQPYHRLRVVGMSGSV